MTVTIDELKKIPGLQPLSDKSLKLLADVMVKRHYTSQQIIFLENEPAQGIWFILEGRVRIIKMSNQGRTQTLCVTGRAKCFGGCPLFDEGQNMASAQAVDDAVLVILLKNEIEFIQQQSPELLLVLLQIFSRRFMLLTRLGEGLGTWSVSARINDNLVNYAVPGGAYPVVKFTHERLACLSGTAREVVTRHLAKLEKKGIIQLKAGKIILLDIDKLCSRCPDDTDTLPVLEG